MTNPTPAQATQPKVEHARDLQARLYREIGISAVAAALHFTTQPDPGVAKKERHEDHAFLRGENMAA